MPDNLYAVLGVGQNATREQIDAAYAGRLEEPQVQKNRKLRETIDYAHRVLTDKLLRSNYDFDQKALDISRGFYDVDLSRAEQTTRWMQEQNRQSTRMIWQMAPALFLNNVVRLLSPRSPAAFNIDDLLSGSKDEKKRVNQVVGLIITLIGLVSGILGIISFYLDYLR